MKRWWLIGVGLVGVVLAVLLVPRPDTGADVTRPARKSAKKAPSSKTSGRKAQLPRLRPARAPSASPGGAMERVDPVALPKMAGPPLQNRARKHIDGLDIARDRQGPESVAAGKATAPWTLIRRSLLREGTDAADGIAEDVNQLIFDLRATRRDPEAFDFNDLAARQRALASEIEESYSDDTQIQANLHRTKRILDDYYEGPE